jgi:hypothetical protein
LPVGVLEVVSEIIVSCEPICVSVSTYFWLLSWA